MGTPAADLQVLDNGSVVITVTAEDAAGVVTAWPSGAPAPTVSETDPSGFTGPFFNFAAPVATATGFTLTGAVNQAALKGLASLPTGITFSLSAASGFAGQTAPIVVPVTPPVDIISGPAATFVASEAA